MADKQLPLIPGYQVHIEKRTNFPKNHLFDVKNGIPVTDIKRVGVQRTDENKIIAPPAPFIDPRGEAGNKPRSVYPTNISRQPDWVKYDRKVLRYYAHFTEPVYDSPIEKIRVRQCRIYFYLEDKSIHIEEFVIPNSGIPQGRFLERSRIAKTQTEYLDIPDLLVGAEIKIHRRKFRIFDADASTRRFVKENHGIELAAAEQPPVDDWNAREIARKNQAPKESDIRTFVEASLGKPMKWHLEKIKKFLANDRKVLKFWCVWDDPSLYGEKRKYMLFYYLADDTIEVSEIHTPNSGREGFPTLLSRSNLPKIPPATGAALIGRDHRDKIECYTHADLRVGCYVTVYSRHFLITKADEYTKQFYIDVHGLTEEDFEEIKQIENKRVLPKREIPPYTGYGGEVDSLGSFYSLVPKPPRRDVAKLMKYDKVSLRFLARMVSENPEDEARRFTVEFFLADDTIRVFEQAIRNSGFVSGKFLDRRKVKNDATKEWFKDEEFAVGNVVSINGFKFELMEADSNTIRHINGEPLYTNDSVDIILAGVAKGLWGSSVNKTGTFRALDDDGTGTITKDEFQKIIERYGWLVSPEKMDVIWPKIDADGSGSVNFGEFYEALEKFSVV